jgi:hypothetical protein
MPTRMIFTDNLEKYRGTKSVLRSTERIFSNAKESGDPHDFQGIVRRRFDKQTI